MFNISQFNDWNEVTWEEMISQSREGMSLSPNGISFIHKLLTTARGSRGKYQTLLDAPVSGTISMGWKGKEYDNIPNAPLFQKSLDYVINTYDDWTPADYLIRYIKDCVRVGNDKLPISKYPVGRALRNLPSFLREYTLHDKLLEDGYQSIMPTVDMNAQSHVDLIVVHKSTNFYVWNYLNSTKSRKYLPRKVGNRGRIQSGLNVLAPISNGSRETDEVLDWYIPSDYYIDNLMEILNTHPISFEPKRMQSPSYYKDMLVFIK